MAIYKFGPFRLDVEQLLLSRGTTALSLGPKVVETLLALVERPGETLSKAALIDRIWPQGYVEEANLAQNIYVLRKSLREHWDCDAIVTVSRRGYRFAQPVRPACKAVRPLAAAPKQSPWRFAFAAIAVVAIGALSLIAVTASRERAPAHPHLSAQGGRLYAIGQYYWNQRTQAAVLKSMDYFADVIRSDPRDARGFAGMADADAIAGIYGYGKLAPSAYSSRAQAYAEKALALDAKSAEAYAILGILDEKTDPQRSIERLRRAIALDPSYGPAHQWYGMMLLQGGQAAGAVRELQIAAQLDPLSVSAAAWLSDAAYLDRRYGDAIVYARQALDLSPKRYGELLIVGVSYEERGEYPSAIAAFRSFAASCSDCAPEADAMLAHVYATMHDDSRARMSLARARRAGADAASPADIAIALAAMGDRSQALAWFARAKYADQAYAALDPRLDALRGDARFREYVRPA